MKRKHWLILSGALALCTAIAVFAAVNRHTEMRRKTLMMEEVYQRQLMETQEHLSAIALKLSKTPVTGDVRTCVELLSGVSRQADSAIGALSALPLEHASVGGAIKFLNQLSEYSLLLALRAASGDMPGQEDVERLNTLEAQAVLMGGRLSTGDFSTLGGAGFYDEPADKDNGMEYPAMIYDGAFSDARHRGTPKALGVEQVNEEKAIEIARAFVGEERVKEARAGVPSGGPLESWGVTLTLTDGVVLNCDVTRQGGHLLWIMPEHANFTPSLTLEECTRSARQFLLSRGYGAMEPNHYQVYDGLAVINFVAVQDGVLLYPDLIKVQIRMDTGEMVGLESNNYLMNHTRREALAPAVDPSTLSIGPLLEVSATRLCLIPYRDAERLCWEVIGQWNQNEYRVYFDARTGEELQILRILDSAFGKMAA